MSDPTAPAGPWPTTATDVLLDAFERVNGLVHRLLDGLPDDALTWRPDAEANPIGWLVWHLARVQDDHLAGVGDRPQVWTEQGYAAAFGLPYDDRSLGYGHSSGEVGEFGGVTVEQLVAYHDAVHRRTLEILGDLDDAGYGRVVDDSFDPPVTAAVRLVSVVGDTLQHLGQVGYVRGLAERRSASGGEPEGNAG